MRSVQALRTSEEGVVLKPVLFRLAEGDVRDRVLARPVTPASTHLWDARVHSEGLM